MISINTCNIVIHPPTYKINANTILNKTQPTMPFWFHRLKVETKTWLFYKHITNANTKNNVRTN